jgi:hypothetical protein
MNIHEELSSLLPQVTNGTRSHHTTWKKNRKACCLITSNPIIFVTEVGGTTSHVTQHRVSTVSMHRFRNLLEARRLPAPPAPQPSSAGFVGCPVALLPLAGSGVGAWQHVYQLAFEQAQAVVRPSLPERDLLGVWN